MSNKSLKNILNENIESHKNEIKQISKGILLNKIDKNQSQNVERWTSIKKLRHSETHKNEKELKFEVRRDDTFNSRILMFAVGSDSIPNQEIKNPQITKPIRLKAMDSRCELGSLTSHSLISEGDMPIENVSYVNRSPERYNFSSPRYLRRDQMTKLADSEPPSNNLVPHYIHPRYKTQYEQLLRFRHDNVREDDEREQRLLTGVNLVHHLESRLQKNLDSIDKSGRTPNFVRLQVFSDILSDLISESWMFAPILIRIKSAYDDEVERILALPVAPRELLSFEVEQLKQSIYNKDKLENLQTEGAQLDEAIKVCLESEISQHTLLAEERQKLEDLIIEKSNFDEEKKRHYKPTAIKTVPTESEKLELLKIQCWDLMDEISKIQKETRQNMVSRATISHLSEGLQDIGIEVEKLNYHRSQLVTETEDLRKELYEYIVEEDMRADDFRLLESLLNAPSPLSFSDYNESNKWSWYIS